MTQVVFLCLFSFRHWGVFDVIWGLQHHLLILLMCFLGGAQTNELIFIVFFYIIIMNIFEWVTVIFVKISATLNHLYTFCLEIYRQLILKIQPPYKLTRAQFPYSSRGKVFQVKISKITKHSQRLKVTHFIDYTLLSSNKLTTEALIKSFDFNGWN